ncbi:hypothetical protein ACWCV5_27935 [Streptomyces tubercidicus]
MLQQGTIVQHIAVSEHWGAYGTVAGFGDGESYTVDLLAPRTGTAVWGRRSVVRVWDGPAVGDTLPAIRPGGTLPIPGLRPVLRSRRPDLPRPVVGSLTEATVVANWRPECSPYGDPAGWRPVGEGDHRAVILNPDRTTVYKVETCRGRNRREHRTLAGLRLQGWGYAPPTTVWTVPGHARSTEVLAMPYLPNDGTASSTPYPRAGVVDHNPQNITVCRGQYWLIDASGL